MFLIRGKYFVEIVCFVVIVIKVGIVKFRLYSFDNILVFVFFIDIIMVVIFVKLV